jgi:hypothetical protein
MSGVYAPSLSPGPAPYWQDPDDDLMIDLLCTWLRHGRIGRGRAQGHAPATQLLERLAGTRQVLDLAGL